MGKTKLGSRQSSCGLAGYHAQVKSVTQLRVLLDDGQTRLFPSLSLTDLRIAQVGWAVTQISTIGSAHL
jgi:hypothetical protein